MSTPITHYTKYLGDRDPLAVIPNTLDTIQNLTRGWTPDRFEHSYAPGKWSARQILTHLAQTELALGNRARMALTTPGYVAQPFDQDPWVALDAGLSGREAVDAFLAMARMNRAFFHALSPAERATALSHPEYGQLTVDWILHQMAGHHINHLRQLEQIP
jgi:DinB superfamily